MLLEEGSSRYVDALNAASLKRAAPRLTVSWRADHATFASSMERLPVIVKVLRGQGVARVVGAISSYSDEFTI